MTAEFDGSRPVDEYLNQQTELRKQKEAAEKKKAELEKENKKASIHESMDATDFSELYPNGDLIQGEAKKAAQADEEIKKNIRKKLNLDDVPDESASMDTNDQDLGGWEEHEFLE